MNAQNLAKRRRMLKRYLVFSDCPFDTEESTESLEAKVKLLHRQRSMNGRMRNAWPANPAEVKLVEKKWIISRSVRNTLPRQTWRRPMDDKKLLRIVRRNHTLVNFIACLSFGMKYTTFVTETGEVRCHSIEELIREKMLPKKYGVFAKYQTRMVRVYKASLPRKRN